ncbi:hypothetical protein HDU99_004374 [Rhizoclosmatium hyalinum]|nr:hypothetical protein HDU99_004374 [Rhizoclosmatium hyalinum]
MNVFGKSTPAEPLVSRDSVSTTASPLSASQLKDDGYEAGALAGVASGALARAAAQELLASAAEFTLIETLNSQTRDRFADLAESVASSSSAKELSQCNDQLDEYASHVSVLERHVANFELVAAELDDYTRRLEESVRRRIVYPYAMPPQPPLAAVASNTRTAP